MKTNIGASFLQLIDSAFPQTHPLRKICNRNSIKLSYRCTPNIGAVISARNSKLLAPPPTLEAKTCSCPKNTTCPVDGKCLTESVIYQATVIQENQKTEKYIGLTCNTFKKRVYSHNNSFKNEEATQTTLSNHIRKLETKKVNFDIKWEIVDRAKPFSPVTGLCPLCTKEKFYITFKTGMATLNKKSEMFSNCRHKKRVLLCGDKT